MHTLDPWLTRIEQAIIKDVLLEEEQDEYFPKFNVDGLLRGDYKSRMEGYAIGFANGFLSPNDIRRLENMDPIPDEDGGNVYVANGSYVKLKDIGAAYSRGTEPAGPEEQPEAPEEDEPDEQEAESPEKEEHENRRHTERHERRKAERRGGSS